MKELLLPKTLEMMFEGKDIPAEHVRQNYEELYARIIGREVRDLDSPLTTLTTILHKMSFLDHETKEEKLNDPRRDRTITEVADEEIENIFKIYDHVLLCLIKEKEERGLKNVFPDNYHNCIAAEKHFNEFLIERRKRGYGKEGNVNRFTERRIKLREINNDYNQILSVLKSNPYLDLPLIREYYSRYNATNNFMFTFEFALAAGMRDDAIACYKRMFNDPNGRMKEGIGINNPNLHEWESWIIDNLRSKHPEVREAGEGVLKTAVTDLYKIGGTPYLERAICLVLMSGLNFAKSEFIQGLYDKFIDDNVKRAERYHDGDAYERAAKYTRLRSPEISNAENTRANELYELASYAYERSGVNPSNNIFSNDTNSFYNPFLKKAYACAKQAGLKERADLLRLVYCLTNPSQHSQRDK